MSEQPGYPAIAEPVAEAQNLARILKSVKELLEILLSRRGSAAGTVTLASLQAAIAAARAVATAIDVAALEAAIAAAQADAAAASSSASTANGNALTALADANAAQTTANATQQHLALLATNGVA